MQKFNYYSILLARHSRGRRFDSVQLHHTFQGVIQKWITPSCFGLSQHPPTKAVGTPQAELAQRSNGFVERLDRTLLDEHFRIQGRQVWYESVDAMQKSLESYLQHYNRERPHQGRGMNGGTPHAAFLEGLLKKSEAQTDETDEAA